MSQYGSESAQKSTASSNRPGTGPLPPGKRRRRRRLFAIIAALIALLLIILALLFFPRPAAAVTLTPASKTLSNTYTVSIPARILSSAQQGSQTGTTRPGTYAKGTLTFKNWNPYAVTIPKGTLVTDATGQQVVTDKLLVVPPDPIIPGVASVSAHTVKVGKHGNIQALSINQPCCFAGIYVLNTLAFSGGVDASSLQQSDIDQIAKPLAASLTQKAQSDFQSQLKQGEQLVNANPSCAAPVITSNPGVGSITANFTVTVSLKCTGSAYNAQTALPQAESLLKQEAMQKFGPGFNLVGNIATMVEQATAGKNGSVDVLVNASGKWKYQFTAAQKLSLAKLIARKTISEAKALLLQQAGIADTTIVVSGPILDLSGHNSVPDDLRAITIEG